MGTGLLLLSVTDATSGLLKAALIGVLCPPPETAAMLAGAPATISLSVLLVLAPYLAPPPYAAVMLCVAAASELVWKYAYPLVTVTCQGRRPVQESHGPVGHVTPDAACT